MFSIFVQAFALLFVVSVAYGNPTKGRLVLKEALSAKSTFILSEPHEVVSFDQAVRMCRAHGNMKPVSITNREKNLEVVTFLSSYDIESVWTSGNDLEFRNQYSWTATGQPFSFVNWLLDAPLKDESCRCVSFAFGTGNSCPKNAQKCSGWTVAPCRTLRRVLCETAGAPIDTANNVPTVSVVPVPNQGPSTETVIKLCEGSAGALSCPFGGSIQVVRASYGRTEEGYLICPSSNIKSISCHASSSKDIIAAACDGKPQCSIEANNSIFGDPCRGTYKYLLVDYKCV